MQQLLDLLASEFSSASQFAEHPLAVGARLVDHLTALLLGHRQLGLGIGSSIRTAPRRLDLCLLTQPGSLVACLGQHLRCALLGLLANLGSALTRRREHPRGLLAEQPGERQLVHLHRCDVAIGVGGAQLAFEKSFTFVQATEFCGDHTKEVSDLSLVESSPADGEAGIGDRRRRRRIGASKGHGHGTTLRIRRCQMVAIDQLGCPTIAGPEPEAVTTP